MADFNNQWIEVFRAGNYGDKGSYGRADLDKIVANYDSAVHEAPIVIGHPELDSPAYGWISALRRSGDALEAQAKQVDSGFEEMLKQGKFKQRSVALYNDLQGRGLYLRHLGFLGATPPEVKGLKAIFHDADSKGAVELEFDADSPGAAQEEPMEVKEMKQAFMETLREFAESVGLKKKEETPPVKTFSEAELTAAKATAAAEAKAAAELAFAEQQNLAAAKAAHRSQVREFIDKLKPGVWIPAFDKMGVLEFMEALPVEASIEFGEEGKKTKQSPSAIFQAFISKLPPLVKFGEEKSPVGAGTSVGVEVPVKLSGGKELVNVDRVEHIRSVQHEAKKSGKALTYSEARSIVMEEERTAGAGQRA